MSILKTLQAKARARLSEEIQNWPPPLDLDVFIDEIIASTIKEFGEEIANEVERWHIKKGGYGNLAEHVRSLTETV